MAKAFSETLQVAADVGNSYFAYRDDLRIVSYEIGEATGGVTYATSIDGVVRNVSDLSVRVGDVPGRVTDDNEQFVGRWTGSTFIQELVCVYWQDGGLDAIQSNDYDSGPSGLSLYSFAVLLLWGGVSPGPVIISSIQDFSNVDDTCLFDHGVSGYQFMIRRYPHLTASIPLPVVDELGLPWLSRDRLYVPGMVDGVWRVYVWSHDFDVLSGGASPSFVRAEVEDFSFGAGSSWVSGFYDRVSDMSFMIERTDSPSDGMGLIRRGSFVDVVAPLLLLGEVFFPADLGDVFEYDVGDAVSGFLLSFEVVSGVLPSGVVLEDGVISGVFADVGGFEVVVRVSNSEGFVDVTLRWEIAGSLPVQQFSGFSGRVGLFDVCREVSGAVECIAVGVDCLFETEVEGLDVRDPDVVGVQLTFFRLIPRFTLPNAAVGDFFLVHSADVGGMWDEIPAGAYEIRGVREWGFVRQEFVVELYAGGV